MKKIGMFKGIMLCNEYEKIDTLKREEVQKERLNKIVMWAKENSPFYRQLYKDINSDFTLKDLPPVNKVQLMEHFDEWLTDSEVKLSDLNKFMENTDNIGRKYKDKYLVFTTSGSTGNPLVCIYDETANNIMGAINTARSFARKQDMKAFIIKGGKSIGVFATGGFYLSNSSVRARLLKMPWKKRKFGVTSALLPTEQIVKELNKFQPAMLGGYPSNLELLIEEQASGRLSINPVIIMTGGEYLSDELRKRLSDTFNCYVQTSYSCTEGGSVACECTEQHFHINDDWVIIEPVDGDNNPVSDSVQSDKILLTNLFNYTQPFIRYEITDRVVIHHEQCKCNNPSPWLTIEGRTDDVASFTCKGREIKVPPLAIYATLKEVHAIKRFQVLVHTGNKIELRIEPVKDNEKEEIFVQAGNTLSNFLKTYGVEDTVITLSKELPRQQSGSGKFKHIICLP